MSDNGKEDKQDDETAEAPAPGNLEHQESKRVIEGEVARKENEKV